MLDNNVDSKNWNRSEPNNDVPSNLDDNNLQGLSELVTSTVDWLQEGGVTRNELLRDDVTIEINLNTSLLRFMKSKLSQGFKNKLRRTVSVFNTSASVMFNTIESYGKTNVLIKAAELGNEIMQVYLEPACGFTTKLNAISEMYDRLSLMDLTEDEGAKWKTAMVAFSVPALAPHVMNIVANTHKDQDILAFETPFVNQEKISRAAENAKSTRKRRSSAPTMRHMSISAENQPSKKRSVHFLDFCLHCLYQGHSKFGCRRLKRGKPPGVLSSKFRGVQKDVTYGVIKFESVKTMVGNNKVPKCLISPPSTQQYMVQHQHQDYESDSSLSNGETGAASGGHDKSNTISGLIL